MRRAIVACAGLWVAGCSRASSAPFEASAMASAAATPSAGGPQPIASAAVDASTAKPFGAACVGDAECAGGACFHKRIKGPDAGAERRGGSDPVEHDGYCSMRCKEDRECPVPVTKGRCGARGMCKRAE